MCVVSLLPLPNGFVLTTNRDEHISRPRAVPAQPYIVGERTVTYPKDPLGGGTWVAASADVTVCLLNGAFEKHVHQPPYRQSRGLVVLDFFDFGNPLQFANGYNFDQIEPFTLVVVQRRPDNLLVHELRWNGQQIYLRDMPGDLPHIWSSVTLYDANTAARRKTWFADFLRQQPHVTPEDVFYFHQTAGIGDPEQDYVVRLPNGVQTVSITQVVQTGSMPTMRYLPLVADEIPLRTRSNTNQATG
ncbi:hypothetical protein BN8_01652 [Fibrisoma limi BUZ 3]|uniref:Transport and Golgi organization protein 2 n=1 Tax=Fibrisoma limi BUZ 3 TaxID=1185876 RepID=I2GFG3_9BACT|nr:NRDE family protein [Fibrisoma limi]CCH52638.1 hypothetical protein BN8_01652 [Fibrisoma limi BUZ 3]